MLYEIDAFGIKATLVEPGLARRDEPDNLTNPLPTWGHFFVKPASEAYAHPTAPAGHAKRMVTWLGDRQPTSAVKCAELVWQIEDWKHLSFPLLASDDDQDQDHDHDQQDQQDMQDHDHDHDPEQDQEQEHEQDEQDHDEHEQEHEQEQEHDHDHDHVHEQEQDRDRDREMS
ncbi:MAG: hypothetical protein M1837_002116 [Sclerophora amabilis]|nr:MAG: hypothetical protein M1837_002116 [Sclerophora amabilis]